MTPGFLHQEYVAQYEVIDRSKPKSVAWLKKLCQSSSRILLATDPDREGEAISWLLAEVLRLKNPERISFNKVTESAVTAALAAVRRIDMSALAPQGARRVIDRLVGYQVSGPLGRVLAQRGVSAGRVQSPALALVVERERAIKPSSKEPISARYCNLRTPTPDSGPPLGNLPTCREQGWKGYGLIGRLPKAAATRTVRVLGCTERTEPEAPPAPFITSTLQQAAFSGAGL